MNPFPVVLFHLGPLAITDSVLVVFVLSALLVVGGMIALRFSRARFALELAYDLADRTIRQTTEVDASGLAPLVVTLWLFLGVANLVSLVPGVSSPTRDLSLTVALAVIAFSAGHVNAIRKQGLSYLKHYLEPSPFLLPFNVIGEIARTIALALRLFGNMLSGHLVVAILLYLVGLFVPIPLMLLGVLTGLVQAYIFGVLTLVFAASSIRQVEADVTRSALRKEET